MLASHTTLGNKSLDESGMILLHEHILVNRRPLNTPGYAQAEVEDLADECLPPAEGQVNHAIG